jgi:hypothetical protein
MRRAALLLSLTMACGASPRTGARPPGEDPMKDVPETYVKLVLALGKHDPLYVDAYHGPPEWQADVDARSPSLDEIRDGARALAGRLRDLPEPGDPLERQRRRFLSKHVEALRARADFVAGEKLGFDEESRAFYDAVAPRLPDAHFESVIARLDEALPGDGPVSARLEAFRKDFIIPRDKLDAVFRAAVEECRARTLRHLRLPEDESFTIEYVTGKPWSGYNWYKGGYRSVIQVNTDLPIYIHRAVDLACHEGYPGHHAYNVLLEERLVNGRGWRELTVYPLYSPMSLIAEGTANLGIEVAFPGAERTEFEQRVLYPLAGLDPSRAAAYARVARLAEELSHAHSQAARRRVDGELDADATAAYLREKGLLEADRARKYVQFIDINRSYVINYDLGLDLVRAWLARQVGPNPPPERRWEALERLLTSPVLPSDLAS